jgi:hypothetical protein
MKKLNKIAISTMIVLSSITAVNAEYFMKTHFQAGMIQEEQPATVFTASKTFVELISVDSSVSIKVIDESKIDHSIYPWRGMCIDDPQTSGDATSQSLVNHWFTHTEPAYQTVISNAVDTSTSEDQVFTITYPERGIEVTYKSKAWKQEPTYTANYTISIAE